MRYLNRIIFINSAHVPYAEVSLDGNVHFIGTQGVGKSTLLRSILFFYNADKSRLGIRTQDKQQGYDDFYLPYSNSYIIYEVVRENGIFFIMSFRSQGRTAFRIVDCKYDRSQFIDEAGMAREWGKINEAIGQNIFKSRILRHYEEFRDIIYGNRQNVDPNLRRFCIMESDRYQNIVRAITNIFLNQSLESRVIKDTIIDSLDFSNDNVDLASYREHINEFRNRYDDIWKWYKREKNGSVKVRVDADKVIDSHIKYEALCSEINELCGQLMYALERDEKSLPEMIELETKLSNDLTRQRRLISEEAGKYSNERDKLKQTEGILNDFLKRVKDKIQYYQNIRISDIVSRINREGELNIQKGNLEKQLELLTNKNLDVTTRYKALLQTEKNKLSESLNEIESHFNKEKEILSEEKNQLIDAYNKTLESIRNQYEEEKKSIAEELRLAENERNDLKIRKIQIINTNPYSKEMTEINGKISEYSSREKELTDKLSRTRSEIDRSMHKDEIAEKDLTAVCEKDVAQIENQIALLNTELEKNNDLLKRYDGSLMEWLCENRPGWEENIGLLLDEQAVLYNTNLNPQMGDDSDSIYGIRLNTANIERDVRSPRELKNRMDSLERNISELQNQIICRKEKLRSDINDILGKSKKFRKSLQEDELTINTELSSIPARMTRLKKELSELDDKLKKWQKAQLDEIDSALSEVLKRIDGIKSRQQQADAKYRKDKKTCEDNLRKQRDDIAKRTNLLKAEIEKEKNLKTEESEKELCIITARMDAELKGAGVNLQQLDELRRQLSKISDELVYIERNKQTYFEWLKDKKEFLDQEDEKRSELKATRKKLDDLKRKYDDRKLRLDSELHRLDSELKKTCEDRSRRETAISKVKGFLSSESRPKNFDSILPFETVKSLSDIFESLRDRLMNYQRCEESFRKTVNDFKGNFSSVNTLGFEFDISSIADYRNFAVKLSDFISNNMIEIMRTRTNEMYADIIQRISREVSDLIQHGADIRKTINDINKDFRDNNFAGVIKEIELRAVESNDRIMQQLLIIKSFDDNHGQDLGELNLFSDIENRDKTNERAAKMLMTLGDLMDAESKRERVTLADTFKLEFKVKQNDQDTNWVEKLTNVGSDGTDILVKAIVNIMLINVFKRKASSRFGDFTLHCMMDEIGKLHPNNVAGILAFANARNIRLINSSPTTYNASAYRYTYSLSKDAKSNTIVKSLLTIR